jgi:hypothetical protein
MIMSKDKISTYQLGRIFGNMFSKYQVESVGSAKIPIAITR